MTEEDILKMKQAFVSFMKEKNSTEIGRRESLKTLMLHVKQDLMKQRQEVVSDNEAWDKLLEEVQELRCTHYKY